MSGVKELVVYLLPLKKVGHYKSIRFQDGLNAKIERFSVAEFNWKKELNYQGINPQKVFESKLIFGDEAFFNTIAEAIVKNRNSNAGISVIQNKNEPELNSKELVF